MAKTTDLNPEDTDSKTRFSKRDFIKSIGLTGAAAVVGGASVGSAQAEQVDAEAVDWDHDVDILVVGAGNGGMSAAIAAAEGGANTLLLEISTQIGGNTLMSGGIMHTSAQRTWDDYNRYSDGEHDQVLGKVYVETFWNEYIPWLQSHDAYMSRPDPDGTGYGSDWHLGHGEPGQMRHKLYFDSLVAAFERHGGEISRKTRVTKLFTDDQERVIGAQARVWEQSPREENQRIITIRAKKTILSIGGWIMDGEKKQLYLGQDGHLAHHFCGPFSSGEGIEMVRAVGGAMSQSGWPTFSGTLCALTATPQFSADPDRMVRLWSEISPEDWAEPYARGRLSAPGWVNIHPQFGGASRAILVNKDGKRFVDEASPNLGKYPRIPQAVIRQRGGYAWMIADQEIHDEVPGSAAVVRSIADEKGVLGTDGNVIIADTLDELIEALGKAGVHKAALRRTIDEYNQAVDDGTQEELDVSHYTGEGSGGYAIRTGPFYAIPVTTDLYLTYGGIRIDENARVLDAQGVPIGNLYAPPPLGGGIQNGAYMGAIACAGTFGFLAGRHAAQAVDTTA